MAGKALRYALGPREKIGRGFLRILDEISQCAREVARRRRGSMVEAVHDARVLGKRLRALLWFGRPVLAKCTYEQAKVRLREAAALLASLRDEEVIRATLGKLEKKAEPRDRAAIVKVAGIVAASPPGADQESEARTAVRRAVAILRRTTSALKKSAAASRDWPDPRARVKKARRKMTRAGEAARRSGDDLAYHEWRKKAKRLLYELELADPHARRKLKTVDKLQNELGVYHDIAVAEERIRQVRAPKPAAKRVIDLLRTTKARSRKKADLLRKQL